MNFIRACAKRSRELAHKFVILMIGRYSEEKRQDVLIEAVKRSAHSHRIQLILAGQGPKELQPALAGKVAALSSDHGIF